MIPLAMTFIATAAYDHFFSDICSESKLQLLHESPRANCWTWMLSISLLLDDPDFEDNPS